MLRTHEPTTSQSAAARAESERLLSLDAFRGLTILAMILVNNPGRWGDQYWPLAHAEWHGWTPTDLVFPFFLFIVGTSLAYSLRRFRDGERIAPSVYWRIARRTIVLILLGLFLNAFGRVLDYASGDIEAIDFSTLRLPGVLQRIAVVYFISSLVVLHHSIRAQAVLAGVLLLGYWALVTILPVPGDYERNLSPDGNVVRVVDRAVFTERHMYTQARTEMTEPEGLLSTLPAIVTCLMGYWMGVLIQRRGADLRTVLLVMGCGAICVEIGLVWDAAFPINKKIWTSSFVLLTGGLAAQLLATSLMLFDVWRWRGLARPLAIVGVNAIFVFVAASMMSHLLGHTQIGATSVHEWLYENVFTSWLTDPKLASFSYALATAAFWWCVCWAMSRLGWTIRV
jgi:predicted acyltransferase